VYIYDNENMIFTQGIRYSNYPEKEDEWNSSPLSEKHTDYSTYCFVTPNSWGVYHAGKKKVAGIECDYYCFDDYYNLKYARWKNVTLYYEQGFEIIWEASAITFKVPNDAFTRTFNTTWVK
jgi:hypothetical protein